MVGKIDKIGLIVLVSSRLNIIFESFVVKNFTCSSSSSFLAQFNPVDDTMTFQTSLILRNGVRIDHQSSSLCIFIEDLSAELRVTADVNLEDLFFYADDILVLYISPHQVEKCIQIFEEWSQTTV